MSENGDICPVEPSSPPCELAQEKGMDCCAECEKLTLAILQADGGLNIEAEAESEVEGDNNG